MVTFSGRKARKKISVYRCLLLLLFVVILPLLLFLQYHYHVHTLSSIPADPIASSAATPPEHDIVPTNANDPNSSSDNASDPPVQIAYAISLIKCGDKQSSIAGLLDAASVLRHSVHQTSVRNPSSNSKYDYKMYAIVHSSAERCSDVLKQLGYTVLVKDPPVTPNEIRGEYLRKNVHKEWCCGSDEFVKLYAYTIVDHPIVVHTDIDFMYYRPMDDLYDAMLLPPDSEGGREARRRIELEYPDTRDEEGGMPEDIRAYLTRDYHQVIPGRKPAFQAGFLVLKPDVEVFRQYLEVIREGNYVGGFSRENGWGGKGYGGVVGSMAMQGLPAYFYDQIRPNTSVELNGCRYNHMGADVLYRNVPNFIAKYKDLHGKCRRNVEGCEDCQFTDLGLIKNFHFTNCRKPWNCAGRSGEKGGKDIDPRTANYDHCMEVISKWHEMRTDLEEKLYRITGKSSVKDGQKGLYKKEVFMGHCEDDGQQGYLPIASGDVIFTSDVSDKIWNSQS